MIRKSAWPSVVPSAMMSRSLPICRCFLLMAHTPSEIGDIAPRRTDGSAFSEREPGTLARCLAVDGISRELQGPESYFGRSREPPS